MYHTLQPLSSERLLLYPLTLKQYYNFIYHLPLLTAELNFRYEGQPVTGVFKTALEKRYLKFLAARRQPFFYTLWLLIAKDSNTVIGNIGFKGCNELSGSIEIGYGLGSRHRGHGYMTEAVTLLTDFALTLPAVNAVTAVTAKDNLPSIAVLQKSNFFYTYSDQDYLYWTKSLE